MKPLAQNLGLCKLCWHNLEHNRQTENAGIIGFINLRKNHGGGGGGGQTSQISLDTC